ncbi:unnamed protein product [Adineta steineri]|uniref:Uncharacterized protein n=1 Tax=Adineta steineri TaxID=433720 RepID=A0A819RFH1_9BILA|nr:unnamed protein product [Adineta steineri]CAF1051122.1 unnamed protein product [Adineta steineri]CAF3792841.1 unnamed protein product [Adineta steineri]CAF4041390.1 unnamed protein product [Adineta steineri]
MNTTSSVTVVRIKKRPRQNQRHSYRKTGTKYINCIKSKGEVSASSQWNMNKSIDLNPVFVDIPAGISSTNILLNRPNPKSQVIEGNLFSSSYVNSKKTSPSLTHFDSFNIKSHSKKPFVSRIEPFSTSNTLNIIPLIPLFNNNKDEDGKQNRYDHHRRRRRCPFGMHLSCCSPCCCLTTGLFLALLLVGLATLIGMLLINKLSTTTTASLMSSTRTTSTTITSVTMTTTELTSTTTISASGVSVSTTRTAYYATDSIVINCSTSWTNVTIQIAVSKTVGATFASYFSTFRHGYTNQSYIDNGTDIICTRTIISGQTINCKYTGFLIEAQHNLVGTSQPNNVDSYTIILETSSGGTTVNSGYF